jgi:hypothetical protein
VGSKFMRANARHLRAPVMRAAAIHNVGRADDYP